MQSETPNPSEIEQPKRNDRSEPELAAAVGSRPMVQPDMPAEAADDLPQSQSEADATAGSTAEAAPEANTAQRAREPQPEPMPAARAPLPTPRSAAAAESIPGSRAEPAASSQSKAEPHALSEKTPERTGAALQTNPQTAVELLVAERLHRMANARMDQRKLSRLLKGVIDQVNLNEGLPRPVTVGARDLLAQNAATRLLRQPLAGKDLPRLLADAASRLPEVATRIEAQVADASNQRRDRITAKQVRLARQAGALGGLDPWG